MNNQLDFKKETNKMVPKCMEQEDGQVEVGWEEWEGWGEEWE